MTYEEWIEQHAKKHKALVTKLHYLSDEELIEYFDFENMVKNEPEFCPLYKDNTKCHDIEKLNCYFCACPHFRLETHKSYCAINSKDGGFFEAPDGFIHQDCSKCFIPHGVEYIKNRFDRDWLNAMKDVKTKK